MNNNEEYNPQKGEYSPEPRVYELGYHLIPVLNDEDVEKEREALLATITTLGGEIIDEGKPSLIHLAYPIDKVLNNKRTYYEQAYFGWIKFILSPDQLVFVKKDVEREKNILRYLLIKTVKENTIFSEQPYKLAKQESEEDEFEDENDSEFDEVAEDDDLDEKIESLLEENNPLKEEFQQEENEEENEESKMSEEKKDDLTKIEGIGPKISEILSKHGVDSFEKLADSLVEKLRIILKEEKLSSHDPETWPKQAELARDGKWDELKELQDKLNGGRE